MFEQISNLISVLQDVGALERGAVVNALIAFAPCIEDLDYRSHMFGEISIKVAVLGDFDRAEDLARLVVGTEKAEFLRRIAAIEAEKKQGDRALRLFLEAREAALIHRFPTQRAQALSEIAESLEAAALHNEAFDTWSLVVQLAKEGQNRQGTDGPEAAGVLLNVVAAFCRAGRIDAARSTAELIVFADLREKARRTIDEC